MWPSLNFAERLANRLPTSTRHILALSSGTAVGQIVAIVAAPLIARLYSPMQFGVFATCSAVIATLGTVAAFRFELAIPLPEAERDAQGLAILGFASTCIVGVGSTVALFIGRARFGALFDPGVHGGWLLWLIPPSVFAMGFYLVLNQLALRHARFREIGKRNAWQQVMTVGVQVVLGVTGVRAGGLLIGLGMGQVTSVVALLPRSGVLSSDARDARHLWLLRSLAWRYRRFPLMLGPSGLLNVLGLQLPVVLLAHWFGATAAGWLGLTQRVLAFPVALIGTAIGQVYLSQLASALRSDHTVGVTLFRRTSLRLGIYALVLAIVLVALGPSLFGTIFGSSWYTSGTYARAMALALATQLIAAPLSQTLVVLERQRDQLIWDVFRLSAVYLTLFAAHRMGASASAAVYFLGLTLAVTYTISWLVSLSAMRGYIHRSKAVGE